MMKRFRVSSILSRKPEELGLRRKQPAASRSADGVVQLLHSLEFTNALKEVVQSLVVRRVLAILLALPLLAMTSWASACDLSCSLQRFHSTCKLDGAAMPSAEPVTASSNMVMDPNMQMPGMSPTEAPVHLHATCTHNPCNETSISAISKSAQHSVPTLQAIALDTPFVASLSYQSLRLWAAQGPPALPPFDPLSVSLRL